MAILHAVNIHLLEWTPSSPANLPTMHTCAAATVHPHSPCLHSGRTRIHSRAASPCSIMLASAAARNSFQTLLARLVAPAGNYTLPLPPRSIAQLLFGQYTPWQRPVHRCGSSHMDHRASLIDPTSSTLHLRQVCLRQVHLTMHLRVCVATVCLVYNDTSTNVQVILHLAMRIQTTPLAIPPLTRPLPVTH
jgi:hypothetical protein